jgi:SAM-dependent methyltransferase
MNSYSSLPKNPSHDVRDGQVLIGENLSDSQLKLWYEQEESAFYMVSKGTTEDDPWYAYMRYVNVRLGVKNISSMCPSSAHIVSLGPGDGSELPDILREIDVAKMTLVEASTNFQFELKNKFPIANIVSPKHTGILDIESNTVDIIVAFGVLHHIPNPSKIIAESARILKSGGVFITREPCSSMGLWHVGRIATPNERGIPSKLLLKFASDSELKCIFNPVPIMFEPINKLLKKTVGFRFIPFSLLYLMDMLISRLVSWNDYYWRDTFLKKIGPSSYFYIFRKP